MNCAAAARLGLADGRTSSKQGGQQCVHSHLQADNSNLLTEIVLVFVILVAKELQEGPRRIQLDLLQLSCLVPGSRVIVEFHKAELQRA
jgi:hypothetical protein